MNPSQPMGIGLNLMGRKVNGGDQIFYTRKFAYAPGSRFKTEGWNGCRAKLEALWAG
ncbi:MAG: hypothetical protein OXI23_06095 [Gemmatimonadota bacterium]|nr:hypothetical protein [Gemmatimonadota bacterium]